MKNRTNFILTYIFIGMEISASKSKKTTTYIYGASGHGKVVFDILRSQGVNVGAFFDDRDCVPAMFCGVPVLRFDDQKAIKGQIIVAIGDAELREKIVKKIEFAGTMEFISAIHTSAVVSPSVEIAEGTVLMAGTVVNAGTHIGKHVIVNTNASVDHDCVIGDFVHIAPGATICGNVVIDKKTWVGAGTTIIQGKHIGENSFLGAGAVIISNVPNNALFVGNPAKFLRATPPPPPPPPIPLSRKQ